MYEYDILMSCFGCYNWKKGGMVMEKIVACCGCICDECPYYPVDCQGCPKIDGKPFWLEYKEEDVCSIYQCCVNEKELPHCGRCGSLPCARFDQQDPTRTPEENAEGLRQMIEVLESMK